MPDRKADPRSALKTLTPDRQALIAEYAVKHSLAEIVSYLAADGIKTSAAAVSTWLSDYQLEQNLRVRGNMVELILAEMKKELPGMLPEEIYKAGQFLFSGLTMQAKDERGWGVIQRLEIQNERNRLLRLGVEQDRQKLEFDIKKYEEQAAKTKTVCINSALTAEEKQSAIKQIFGIA